MRLAVLFSICVSLGTASLCKGAQSSEIRDLPPLKLAATDLDAILIKTHSFIEEANGPEIGEGASRQTVKVGIAGEEIEIPHFSLASSLAFPNEIFKFSYTYSQPDEAISSVTIDLGDSSRQVSVRGESSDKVRALSNLLQNELQRHSTSIGGTKFRRVVGVCLSMLFLMSLMISTTYCLKNRFYSAWGMPICSALGFLLVLLVPWNRFLAGFILYERYSPFFLVRHASEFLLLAVLAALAGIPISYFLSRNGR
jgi:hypothetical protein